MSDQYKIVKVHYGQIIDDQERLTLMQLSSICQLPPERIIEIVDEGILEPDGTRIHTWRFPFSAAEKVRKVLRFEHDLRINLAGAALALHLLDRIAQLESDMRRWKSPAKLVESLPHPLGELPLRRNASFQPSARLWRTGWRDTTRRRYNLRSPGRLNSGFLLSYSPVHTL